MLRRGIGSHRFVHGALAALLVSVGLSGCGGSSSASGSTSPANAASISNPFASVGSSSSGSSSSSSSASSLTATATPSAKSVTLSWTPPTQNSDGSALTACASSGGSGNCLAGYTLHYGSSSENYTGEITITDPSSTSYVLSDTNFPAGTYYFAISAYNGMQTSSAMSAEVQLSLD